MATTTTTTPPASPQSTFEQLFDTASLRGTAATVRKEIRLIRGRDCVDWIDWFVSLDESLAVLSSDVLSGS